MSDADDLPDPDELREELYDKLREPESREKAVRCIASHLGTVQERLKEIGHAMDAVELLPDEAEFLQDNMTDVVEAVKELEDALNERLSHEGEDED